MTGVFIRSLAKRKLTTSSFKLSASGFISFSLWFTEQYFSTILSYVCLIALPFSFSFINRTFLTICWLFLRIRSDSTGLLYCFSLPKAVPASVCAFLSYDEETLDRRGLKMDFKVAFGERGLLWELDTSYESVL